MEFVDIFWFVFWTLHRHTGSKNRNSPRWRVKWDRADQIRRSSSTRPSWSLGTRWVTSLYHPVGMFHPWWVWMSLWFVVWCGVVIQPPSPRFSYKTRGMESFTFSLYIRVILGIRCDDDEVILLLLFSLSGLWRWWWKRRKQSWRQRRIPLNNLWGDSDE